MRRITQEEFDKVCNQINTKTTIYDCIIGEDIVFPKQVEHVIFDHCDFDKALTCIEFSQVKFNNCYVSAFIDCILRTCQFNKCEFLSEFDIGSGYFSNCSINATTFELCELNHAMFSDCNISDTCFWCSNLYDARFENITNCHDVTFKNCETANCIAVKSSIVFPQHIPSEGSFIAWKKARMWELEDDHYNKTDIIVKLRIPENAKRCSANHKCRANMVEVIQYETLDGCKLPDNVEVHSFFNRDFTYHIGMIESRGYNSNPQSECSNGIHFFLNRDDAVNYVF